MNTKKVPNIETFWFVYSCTFPLMLCVCCEINVKCALLWLRTDSDFHSNREKVDSLWNTRRYDCSRCYFRSCMAGTSCVKRKGLLTYRILSLNVVSVLTVCVLSSVSNYAIRALITFNSIPCNTRQTSVRQLYDEDDRMATMRAQCGSTEDLMRIIVFMLFRLAIAVRSVCEHTTTACMTI